jgi:hypothetical protein
MPASRSRRILVRVVFILAAVWAILCGAFYWAMRQPPAVFGRIASRLPMPLMIGMPFETLWRSARAGRIHPGETAPDFALPTVDRKETVSLASFRGSKPVVLVFGSYT